MRNSGLAGAALLACLLTACVTEQAPSVIDERQHDVLVSVRELRTAPVTRRVGVGERLTRAEVAGALGVHMSLLVDPTVLTPARLEVQGAWMDLYCAAEVLQGSAYGYARFVPSACQGFGQASLFFEVVAGHTYLIDCAVKPGNTTWQLRRWGQSSAQTASNTEHPLFAFTADTSGTVGFSLRATSDVFFVYRCEITAAG